MALRRDHAYLSSDACDDAMTHRSDPVHDIADFQDAHDTDHANHIHKASFHSIFLLCINFKRHMSNLNLKVPMWERALWTHKNTHPDEFSFPESGSPSLSLIFQ